MIFFSKIRKTYITLVKFTFILTLTLSSFPTLATEYSSSDGSSVENRPPGYSISNVDTGGRTRLDVSRKKKPVASRSAKLMATVSSSGTEEESLDAAPTRTKLSISRKRRPKASRQATTTSRNGTSELGGLSSGEEKTAKPSRRGRTRTFGVGIARNKIGAAIAPKKEEAPRVFRLLSSKVTSPVAVTINPGNNTTIITGDVPQLDSRGIDLVKEYPEITVANGQDTTLLDQVPPILGKKKIEPIKTVTVVEQSVAVPTVSARKPRRTRTFGVGIERKKFSTNTSAPKQQADRVFHLPPAPRAPVEIAPGVNTTIIGTGGTPQLDKRSIATNNTLGITVIANGSDTTALSGPSPILDSRVIAVDKTLQQKEIPDGSDTTQTIVAPQLGKRLIATNNTLGITVIANGSDATALGGPPPILDSRIIAVDKTLQPKEIEDGSNTTQTIVAPQLDKRSIAKNNILGATVIANGSDTTALSGPPPILDSRVIAVDKTLQQKEIPDGSNTTQTIVAPQLDKRSIATNNTLGTTVVIANGSDTTALGGLPPILDSRIIAVDKTLQQREIEDGSDTIQTIVAPQLDKRSIATNKTIGTVAIANGSDTTALGGPPPILNSRVIAVDKTLQQKEIPDGSDTTQKIVAPQLDKRTIATNTLGTTVIIANGSDTTALSGPSPILDSRVIAVDKTLQQKEIPDGSDTTQTIVAPQLDKRSIAKNNILGATVIIANGSDTTALGGPPPILDSRVIAIDKILQQKEIPDGSDTTQIIVAPQLDKRPIATNTLGTTVVIANGSDTTALGGPPPILDSRVIAIDKILQQKEIPDGSDTTQTIVAPQLGKRPIATNNILGATVIANGSDTTALGGPPILDSRVIAVDKALQQKEIPDGSDTTQTIAAPQLDKRSIATNTLGTTVVIANGSDTTALGGPPPILDSRVIAVDKTLQQKEIPDGSNTTQTIVAPQLDKRSIATNTLGTTVVIANGSNTTVLGGPPPILDSRVIAVDKTLQQKEIQDGSNTTQTIVAPQLDKRSIATNNTLGTTVVIANGSDTIALGGPPPILDSRVIAIDKTLQQKEIPDGSDTTQTIVAPQLDKRSIAKNNILGATVVIANGSDTIALGGPPPILDSRVIAIDKTLQQKEIPDGSGTVQTIVAPQLDSRRIDLVKEYPEITIANGQDTTLLDQVPPILGKKKIELNKTVTVVERSIVVPKVKARKPRRTRTFGVGIERKKFGTSAPKQQQATDRVFYLPSAPRAPVEINSGVNTTIIDTGSAPQLDKRSIETNNTLGTTTIANGSDTTALGGPSPILDSRVIAVDKTLQQKEIPDGSDTAQIIVAPQLDKRSIATNKTIRTAIANGSDTTALGGPPALDVRVIAPNKTLQLSEINSGLDSTSHPLPPQLTKREILPNKTIINPVIATGNNTTALGGPVPTLDSRTIPTDKTIQGLDITPGSDPSVLNPAPVLAQREIAKDKAITNITIPPGSNPTVTNPAPILEQREIAKDKTITNVTIPAGSDSTVLNPAPVLAQREIAKDKAITNVAIPPGSDPTVTNPAPVLAPKEIAKDTVINVTIAPGNDSTATNLAPVLAQREIAKDKTVATTSSTNSTSLSMSSYPSTSNLESTLKDNIDDNNKLDENISIESNEPLPPKRTSTVAVQNIVKVAAEHYVKNVGSYAIDSIDAITGIIANRLDGLFKPSAIAVAAGDNPNILERGIWLKIFGSKTIQDGHSQSNARFENKQQGFVLGADIDFKGEVTGGIAFSMNDSNTDFFSNINNYQESKLYSGILYGEFSMWDNFAINAQLKYGHSFIKHSILTKSPIRGETRGSIFGASLEGIYKFVSNRTQITPLARVSYTSYDIYDFTEQNKQGNIQVQIPNKKASMISTFGSLSFKRNFPFKTLQIEPEFHFGVERVMNISHSTDVISIVTDNIELVNAKFIHPTKMRYNFGGNLYFISRRGLRFGLGGDYMYGKNFRSQAMFANILVNF